ncbi:hypothetical protein Pcinc_003188 [Petrolisthes cinctipes]|uniref:Uncharacterized protein n=1 Tax=Petrolisthes cinctipes TaxID=88211 RepID=A0AAE1GH79_PETCI|nr:hypothetical protein Pcinc_003188 [Petrolisthes cinctipes]
MATVVNGSRWRCTWIRSFKQRYHNTEGWTPGSRPNITDGLTSTSCPLTGQGSCVLQLLPPLRPAALTILAARLFSRFLLLYRNKLGYGNFWVSLHPHHIGTMWL